MVLIIVSNTVYQICTKSVPDKVSPFASLTVTYLIGAAMCAVMHFITHPHDNLIKEVASLNWSSYVLGLVIVGLEVGWIYAYKAGWQVSTGFIAQSSILAVVLIFVGALLYRETVTWNKIVGILVCLVGLGFINFR